jgi:hypothetical protein
MPDGWPMGLVFLLFLLFVYFVYCRFIFNILIFDIFKNYTYNAIIL